MPRRRRTSAWGAWMPVLAVFCILMLGTVGTFASLYLGGYFRAVVRKPSREGLIAIPRTMRAAKAYQKLRREDIVALQQGDDSYLWVDKGTLERNPEWLRSPSDVIGRVLARDKEPGYVFQEKDFLPKGTREGVVAGIPPGKRAMVVQAEKIHGLSLLARGDAFDLFATLPIKGKGDSIPEISLLASEGDTLTGGTRTPESRAASIQNRLGVKLLVRRAVLVDALDRPSSARNARANQPAAKDITIALSPEEVISLTHALSLEYSVFCAAISGQPGDSTASEPEHPLLKGMIPVPVRGTLISPLTQVSRDHLLDSATGQLSVLYFKPEDIDADWITRAEDLLGRVTASHLDAGLPFRQSDFQPLGTRPGITGGTPAGQVAITLDAATVSGLDALQPGDRFTLVSAETIDLRAQFPQLRVGSSIQHLNPDKIVGDLQHQAHISVLVRQGTVVAIHASTKVITVAVLPQEVPPLTKALANKAKVYCIASAGDENRDTQIVSAPHPYQGIAVIEKIQGQSRTQEAFATAVDDPSESVAQQLSPR